MQTSWMHWHALQANVECAFHGGTQTPGTSDPGYIRAAFPPRGLINLGDSAFPRL